MLFATSEPHSSGTLHLQYPRWENSTPGLADGSQSPAASCTKLLPFMANFPIKPDRMHITLSPLVRRIPYVVVFEILAIALATFLRSEARRVGQEWVSTCKSRWSPSH